MDYIPGDNPDAPVRQKDLINFTLIQTRVYASPVVTGLTGSPAQLQLSYQTSTEGITYRKFVATLNDWIEVLNTSIEELDLSNEALSSEVTDLRSQIEAIDLERSLLELNYSLNESTYKTLRTKLEEVQFNIDAEGGPLQVLSVAIPPEEALPHNTVRNTLIAMVAAGVLAVIAVLLLDWWKSDKETEEEAQV